MPSDQFRRELVAKGQPISAWTVLTDVPRITEWVSIVGNVTEVAPLERYQAVLADKIGPFKLRADLDVRVLEVVEGERIRVVASGEDRQVSSRIGIDAVLTIRQEGESTTIVTIEGRYEVVGRVASMGAGIISQKAKKILDEFFTRAEAELC